MSTVMALISTVMALFELLLAHWTILGGKRSLRIVQIFGLEKQEQREAGQEE